SLGGPKQRGRHSEFSFHEGIRGTSTTAQLATISIACNRLCGTQYSRFIGQVPVPTNPVGGNLQSASDPFASKDEINLTTELEQNKLTNYARPVPALAWGVNWRSLDFLQFDDEPIGRSIP